MSGTDWQACLPMLKGMIVREYDPFVGDVEPAVVEEAWTDGEMMRVRVRNRRAYEIARNMSHHDLSVRVYPTYAGGSTFTFTSEGEEVPAEPCSTSPTSR